jgi:5-methylcytosine-specific restriction endonuclease McrA
MEKEFGRCELCEREGIETTVHHLVPREEGGSKLPTVNLCKACHKQIHVLYANRELAVRLNTVEALKQDENINKFLSWVKKQSPGSSIRVKKPNRRRG